MSDFECWTCLDFGDLPGLGPCPDCQPDAHAEHVLGQLAAQQPTTPKEGADV
jgi:hypothetical protein